MSVEYRSFGGGIGGIGNASYTDAPTPGAGGSWSTPTYTSESVQPRSSSVGILIRHWGKVDMGC
jgi:hypothetical protein